LLRARRRLLVGGLYHMLDPRPPMTARTDCISDGCAGVVGRRWRDPRFSRHIRRGRGISAAAGEGWLDSRSIRQTHRRVGHPNQYSHRYLPKPMQSHILFALIHRRVAAAGWQGVGGPVAAGDGPGLLQPLPSGGPVAAGGVWSAPSPQGLARPPSISFISGGLLPVTTAHAGGPGPVPRSLAAWVAPHLPPSHST
jgi:hypothetical protein